MIEIKGRKALSAGTLGLGLTLTVIGALLAANGGAPPVALGLFLVVGGLTVAFSLASLLRRGPQLRASAEGLSLAGCATIPWSRIKQIYIARTNLSMHGLPHQTASLAIDFQSKRTLFRLPIRFWILSPFASGDVDIDIQRESERPDVLASHLEAMRVQAIGTIDGVITGASMLPPARAMERTSNYSSTNT